MYVLVLVHPGCLTSPAKVRAIASPTNDLILSASRDTTVISWRRSSNASRFEPAAVIKAGNRYINAVAYIPPSTDAPQGEL
jgi:phospholipase A-2-activating protein